MSFSKPEAVYRTCNHKQVKPVLPQETTPIQYASAWFRANRARKPTLVVGLKNVPLVQTLQHAAQAMIEGRLTGDIAAATLYKIFKSQKQRLSLDWVSFGVVIGNADTEVCPWDLVNVDERDTQLPNEQINDQIREEDAPWIAFYICFLYRYSKATHTDYRDMLYNTAKDHAKHLSQRAMDIQPGSLAQMKNVGLDANYNCAIACIDMFHHKFKNLPLSAVRYGTLPSRFKDCSALTTLNHITKLTGLAIEQFMLWVFSSKMADELDQMSKPDEELDQGDSYVAYMRELGVSDRSPYSAQANPSFSLFCHVVGALLGSKRSKNARMGAEVDTVNSVLNGKIVAYVLGTRPSFTKEYSTDKEEDPTGTAEEDVTPGEIPNGANPDEWFAYLSIKGFVLPDEVVHWVKTRVQLLTDVRDGTVGKFLKTQG
ncbi:N [Kumasi rhabdovirus]|uniref:Nucleoprotein n=1 Tax=Kumasi rhabdovirus TaxID=1537975 RepID=A0A0C4MKA2_9RHAB|nr:N [Kumasi rhabdovirus] [Kumasi rhabdovirus]AIL31432.1 N [Kumasi rhabdovirus] [Kumasi rhabdovirus]